MARRHRCYMRAEDQHQVEIATTRDLRSMAEHQNSTLIVESGGRSVNRRLQSAHSSQDTNRFTCIHKEDGKLIKCLVCLKHFGTAGTRYPHRTDGAFSRPFQLPPITDAALLSVWLFAKLRPWGCQSWIGVPKLTTSEVLELKGKVYRAVMDGFSASDAYHNPFLADAIAILLAATAMTGGFNAAQMHTQAFVRLAKIQIDAAPGGPTTFSTAPLVNPFEQVLRREVPTREVALSTSMPPVWTKLLLHSQDEWFERYKPQLSAITELALSVSDDIPYIYRDKQQESLFYVGPPKS
ncbi:hypothetical protein TI39_contig270g00008 [Zymoseptoria brevis]|uniref:Uncharacterized protein n=1 Tax=Zymoseptoria brevis TaxID=1047168 RepID=A0A0F4GX14_9PEZI|nr:hypothetical protein TI39_contig270g00008 [Zymoseptoria brevis]